MSPKKKHYSASEIGEYFLLLSNNSNKSITNKKLQKLLYYAQAWSMTLKDEPLFNDKIEAWVHGPAIRSVYQEYRKFGFSPIVKDINQKDVAQIKGFCEELLKDENGKNQTHHLAFPNSQNSFAVLEKLSRKILEVTKHIIKTEKKSEEGTEMDKKRSYIRHNISAWNSLHGICIRILYCIW